MKERVQTVPHWIRRGEPEPYPGAFADFVASITEPPCCPLGEVELRTLHAALSAPQGLCVLCGEPSVWRQAYAMAEATPSPVGCGRPHAPLAYVDLCAACLEDPDHAARLAAAMRLRPYAPWN